MNILDLRRAVDATVSPLSDITRASVWQRVEQAIATPPPRAHPLRARVAVLGAVAAAALVVTGLVSLHATAPSPDAAPSQARALVVADGERATHRWGAVVVDVHGPADLRLDRRLGVGVLHVAAGTIRVRHGGFPLVVSTPTSTTWVGGPVFAVRVHGQSTEIASGEESAQALIERTTLVPPPSLEPVPVPVPVPVPDPGPDDAPDPVRDPDPESEPETDPEPEPEPDPESEFEPEPDPEAEAAATYARAEAAMRAGENERAARLLTAVVAAVPGTRVAAAARLDLARLAFARGDLARARRLLDEVLRSDADPNLHPPAQRLRCRIQRAAGEACDAD